MPPGSESASHARAAPEEMPPILVWHAQADEYAAALAKILPGVRIMTSTQRRTGESVIDAPVLLTWRPPQQALGLMPSLRWIQATGAGVDHLLSRDDLGSDVLLTRSHGRFGIQAAEYVVGYLLQLLIGVEQYRRDQDRAVWRPRDRRLLAELTVGILGMGKLGHAVAERLHALGADVLATCRDPRPADVVRRVYSRADWRAMLPHCHALVIATPLTDETRGMIDAEALGSLPDRAMLVNIARGEVIEEKALLDALRGGSLAAAVLDAFAVEPLPADSPLWTEPNAWVTPHVAAPSEVEPIAREFAANYRRYVEDRPLDSVVDRERGY